MKPGKLYRVRCPECGAEVTREAYIAAVSLARNGCPDCNRLMGVSPPGPGGTA